MEVGLEAEDSLETALSQPPALQLSGLLSEGFKMTACLPLELSLRDALYQALPFLRCVQVLPVILATGFFQHLLNKFDRE